MRTWGGHPSIQKSLYFHFLPLQIDDRDTAAVSPKGQEKRLLCLDGISDCSKRNQIEDLRPVATELSSITERKTVNSVGRTKKHATAYCAVAVGLRKTSVSDWHILLVCLLSSFSSQPFISFLAHANHTAIHKARASDQHSAAAAALSAVQAQVVNLRVQ